MIEPMLLKGLIVVASLGFVVFAALVAVPVPAQRKAKPQGPQAPATLEQSAKASPVSSGADHILEPAPKPQSSCICPGKEPVCKNGEPGCACDGGDGLTCGECRWVCR